MRALQGLTRRLSHERRMERKGKEREKEKKGERSLTPADIVER